jgi:hypothetical protein
MSLPVQNQAGKVASDVDRKPAEPDISAMDSDSALVNAETNPFGSVNRGRRVTPTEISRPTPHNSFGNVRPPTVNPVIRDRVCRG